MKSLLCILMLGAGATAAQETPAVDLAARRESVVTLKSHIEMREKRLDEVASEIRERGRKTNQKIEELVKMLSKLKDSEDSKRRISQIKGEAIGGLTRMLKVYKSERDKLAERLRQDPSVAAEGLGKDMAAMDKLIELRAAEILELVKSMPPGTDVSKYEQDGYSYYNGVYYENSRISEAWRQNRRDAVDSEKQRREVRKALEGAIADLESRRNSIKAALAKPGISGPEKEIQEQELAHVSSLLEQRNAQLVDVTDPSRNTSAADQSASKDQADELKQLLADARRDISSDFNKTLRLYREAAGERDKIFALKQNLAAREKWLSENDPEAKKAE